MRAAGFAKSLSTEGIGEGACFAPVLEEPSQTQGAGGARKGRHACSSLERAKASATTGVASGRLDPAMEPVGATGAHQPRRASKVVAHPPSPRGRALFTPS